MACNILDEWCSVQLGWTSTKQQVKCLAQGHNTVTGGCGSRTINPSIPSPTLYHLSHCAPHHIKIWIFQNIQESWIVLLLFLTWQTVLTLIRYSKTCVKRPLSKRPKIGFQDQLSLNAGQKYCRMLQGEHSAILLTFIKLPFVIKVFCFVYFEWLLLVLLYHILLISTMSKLFFKCIHLSSRKWHFNPFLTMRIAVHSLVCLYTLVAYIANNLHTD